MEGRGGHGGRAEGPVWVLALGPRGIIIQPLPLSDAGGLGVQTLSLTQSDAIMGTWSAPANLVVSCPALPCKWMLGCLEAQPGQNPSFIHCAKKNTHLRCRS